MADYAAEKALWYRQNRKNNPEWREINKKRAKAWRKKQARKYPNWAQMNAARVRAYNARKKENSNIQSESA